MGSARSTTSRPYNGSSVGHAYSAQPNEWIVSIKQKLDQAEKKDPTYNWAKKCIYKIPQWLREAGGDQVYSPQIVSLGPYHHGQKNLSGMEQHKWRALNRILKRTKQHIELYTDAIKELEENARACYEGPIYQSSDEFVQMMILDACFVLELFRGNLLGGFKDLGYSENDPIFCLDRPMYTKLVQEVILLENQIPLFIMDALYQIQGSVPDWTVVSLALRFFQHLFFLNTPPNRDMNMMNQGGLHCLEVFRRSLLPVQHEQMPGPYTWINRWLCNWFRCWSDTNPEVERPTDEFIHCITELRVSGIRFKKRENHMFWDIKFENGILEIPTLTIYDNTMFIFRNLIAFEQCHMGCEDNITLYMVFMNNLIDSTADVRYLQRRGIIKKGLGSDDEVTDMFNRLSQEVVCDTHKGSLATVMKQVNSYCDNRWNGWWASFMEKYFNNPWSIISFFAAVLLLVFAMVQTVYTVGTFYRQS